MDPLEFWERAVSSFTGNVGSVFHVRQQFVCCLQAALPEVGVVCLMVWQDLGSCRMILFVSCLGMAC